MGTERGGALVLVLWMSAALGAIALSVSATVRGEAEHAAALSDGLRAHYLATGSLERGVQWMMWGSAARNPDGSVRFWEFRRRRMAMSYPSGEVVVEMLPESGKLDVNRASWEELTRVVAAVSGDFLAAQRIAAAIVNWRQAGAGGVPEDFSLGLGPTFPPRRASLEEIEELLAVPGVTPELFYGNYVEDAQGRLYARGGLRDCLSVWGTTGALDANSVSPAMLEALGWTPEQAQRLVARRQAQPFENVGEIAALGLPTGRLKVGGGTVWTMRATARLRRPDGGPSDVVRSAAAVVKYWDDPRYLGNPVQVIRYYEDGWSQFAVAPPARTGGFAR
jgi:general secretion pathway protein K